MLEFDDEAAGPGRPVIKVIGVGGGGGNAVNTMIEAGVEGVDFIVANTDCQVLEASLAGTKVHLGKNLTKGLGAGANPEIGRAAALEDAQRVAEALTGADMVFVTAGMGGGTGTGAAPVIAQIARDVGALTVGVVTKPFAFEGSQRKKKAAGGIAELAKAVDALIVIPNDRLVSLAGMKMTLKDAFAMVDNVCLNAVRGHQRSRDRARAHQRRLRRRAHDHDRHGPRADGDRLRQRRQARDRGRAAGDQLAAARGRVDQRRDRHPAQHHRRPGPDAGRDERGLQPDRRGRRPRRQHHLRLGDRRPRGRRGAHHRDRHRLQRPRERAADAPARADGRGERRGREGQMALPMQAPPTPSRRLFTRRDADPAGRFLRAGHPHQRRAAEAINLDDFYSTMEQIPALPMGATPATAVPATAPEWMPAERPLIRPSSAASAPLTRRSSGQMPAQSPRPRPTIWASRSPSSTSPPTCAAASTRPNKRRGPRPQVATVSRGAP